jgi:predicted transglutaminase-like cysteine proteinase
MKPQLGMRGSSPFALIATLILLTCGLAASGTFAGESVAVSKASAAAENDRGDPSARPATFFTINSVLAKLDGQRAHKTDAVHLAALTPTTSVTDTPPEFGSAPAIGTEPFGLFTLRAPDGVLWRKWRSVEEEIVRDQAVLEQCRADAENCPVHAAQFLRLISAVKSKSGRAQLEEVNQGVNAVIRYVSDLAQFGELDRWSAALSTFASRKGDCEDYAITKYVALREAGFPEDQLRLLLVRDRSVRQDHAVLAAKLDGRWLILDNRWSGLRDDSDELNFTPLFAINHAGVFLFAKPYAKLTPEADVTEATPAAADPENTEWVNTESYGGSGGAPLLL